VTTSASKSATRDLNKTQSGKPDWDDTKFEFVAAWLIDEKLSGLNLAVDLVKE